MIKTKKEGSKASMEKSNNGMRVILFPSPLQGEEEMLISTEMET